MLTNIINILGITCSMGAGVLNKPNKVAPLPNRNIINHSWSETIQLTERKYHNTETIENTDYFNYIQVDYDHVENSYIKADVMVATTHMDKFGLPPTRLPLGGVAGVSNNKLGHEEYTITENNTEYKYNVIQKVYYLKIEAINTNVETQVNISEQVKLMTDAKVEDLYSYQNVDKYIYQKTYTNTNTSLNKYYPSLNTDTGQYEFNDINLIYKNNNLYDAMQQIIYSTGGYTGTITEDSYFIEDNYTINDLSTKNFNIGRNKEIYVKPNNTNYYIIYEEVKYITTGTVQTNNPIKYMSGYPAFYSTPYTEVTVSGINVVNSTNTEVVNIPGVMIDVLGMPFTFISTAFNLTIFPGTPYELNISLLFLSIIAVGIFVFIVRILVGMIANKG